MRRQSESFREDIQGLRAVSILLVVLYHADGILPAGFIGVDMFFVISGYVIMSSIQSRQGGQNRFSVSNFVARRIRRLFPVMTVVVASTMLLAPWFATVSSRIQTMRTGLFSAASAANIYLFRFRPVGYFHEQEKSNPLLHMWSLSVEEQFYLGLAMAMAVVGFFYRNRRPTRVHFWIFCLIGFMSLISCVVIGEWTPHVPHLVERILGRQALDSDFNFYLPFTRAWEFIAGILMVFAKGRFERLLQSNWRTFLALVLFAVSMFAISDRSVFPGAITVVPVAMTALLIGTQPVGGPLGAVLRARAMQYVGDRSYGWYLWHWPLIQFVASIFPGNKIASTSAAGLSFVLAMITYRVIEVPCLNRELTIRRTLGTGLAPIAMASLVFIVPLHPFPELDLHLDAARGCESGALQDVEWDSPCTFAIAGSRGRAILLGDSHAGQLSEGFVKAAHEMNLDATIAVHAGKPLLADTPAPLKRGDISLLDAAIDQYPKLVVLAQSRYPSLLPSGASWGDVFLPIVDLLVKHKISVVIVNTSSLSGIEPMKCSWVAVQTHRCSADIITDRSAIHARVVSTLAEESAAEISANVKLVNLIDVFCGKHDCPARQDSRWMWRDSSHMSRYASELTAPILLGAMRQVVAEH